MKAVVQQRYGSLEHLDLGELDVPVPRAREVQVRVRAASVHPDVWHVVYGHPYVLRLMGAGFSKPRNPIPGTDMAGVVEGIGNEVTRWEPGAPVFGETVRKQQWVHGGAFAEYVCVHEDLLARKPANVTFEQAASVPASGFITLQNLRGVSRWPPGRRVLINGAGGGVGSLALQIVKAHGAHVTAVDRAAKLDMLRELGADEVIDYEQEDFTRRGVRYDLVFDVLGVRPFSHFKPVLEPDGRYVPIGHEGFGATSNRMFGLIPHLLKLFALASFVKQLRGPSAPAPTKRETIETLRGLLEAGKITPRIDCTFEMHQVRDAFRRMMSGEARGKVIITPTPAV